MSKDYRCEFKDFKNKLIREKSVEYKFIECENISSVLSVFLEIKWHDNFLYSDDVEATLYINLIKYDDEEDELYLDDRHEIVTKEFKFPETYEELQDIIKEFEKLAKSLFNCDCGEFIRTD